MEELEIQLTPTGDVCGRQTSDLQGGGVKVGVQMQFSLGFSFKDIMADML